MNKSAKNKIRVVWYDGNGKHETKPCSSVNVVCVNYSIPSTTEPTITFSLWFGDEENGYSEPITVPFSHSIEPVPVPGAEKNVPGKKAFICWKAWDENEAMIEAYQIILNDDGITGHDKLYKTYKLVSPAEKGDGLIPDELLTDAAILENKGYTVETFF